MLRIGLTGGIGSGKTTVARLFAAHDVPVLDSDTIVHELGAPGGAAYDAIARRFGRAILAPDGRIDRAALGARVFGNPAERGALEEILHPLVYAALAERSATLGAPYVIFVIPLLVESGGRAAVDRVLVVDCPESEQLRRACERDQRTPEAVRRIIAAQATREERLRAADDVIVNNRDLAHLEREVGRLHRYYLSLAA